MNTDPITIRRENLRRLMHERGGPTALASELGYANGSYIAQVAGPNPRKAITEKVAREWETKLGMPVGWFDRNTSWDREFTERLVEIVAMIAELATVARVRLSEKQMSLLAQLVREHGHATGKLDRGYAGRLIELLASR